jgi:hypothetical protein
MDDERIINNTTGQPEAKDARELASDLREIMEYYGADPERVQPAWETRIEQSFQARLASAREQGGMHLPWRESLDIANSEIATLQALRKSDYDSAVKANARAEMAERKGEEMRKAVLDCIPSNWLDPLLTGPSAVIHKFSCPEIEALLNGVKARISAALATPAEGMPDDVCSCPLCEGSGVVSEREKKNFNRFISRQSPMDRDHVAAMTAKDRAAWLDAYIAKDEERTREIAEGYALERKWATDAAEGTTREGKR